MKAETGAGHTPSTDEDATAIDRAEWTWRAAYGRAVIVFLYFAVAVVWLPSFIVSSSTDEGFREIAVTVVWLAAFGGGLWGLVELQRRRWL
jgi:Na+-driven multidrug efflux pump